MKTPPYSTQSQCFIPFIISAAGVISMGSTDLTVVKGAAGIYTVNIKTPFSPQACMAFASVVGAVGYVAVDTPASASIGLRAYNGAGALTDSAMIGYIVAFYHADPA